MSLQTQNALCEEPPSIFESLEKLKNAIWSRRPILKDIMTKHGGKTLYDYSLDFLDVNKTPSLDKRKHELFEVVEKLLKARLGEQTAKKARKQLEKKLGRSIVSKDNYLQEPESQKILTK